MRDIFVVTFIIKGSSYSILSFISFISRLEFNFKITFFPCELILLTFTFKYTFDGPFLSFLIFDLIPVILYTSVQTFRFNFLDYFGYQ